MSSARNYRD